MTGQILSIPIGVCTPGYLACVLYLINYYLPKRHPSAWAQLGRPTIQHPVARLGNLQDEVEKWLLTARFVLWSNDYERLRDMRLARLVWYIRSFAAGCLVGWALLLGFAILSAYWR